MAMTKSLPNEGFLVKCFLALEGFDQRPAANDGGTATSLFELEYLS